MDTQCKNDALIYRNAPLEKELAFVEQQAKLLEEQKCVCIAISARYDFQKGRNELTNSISARYDFFPEGAK
jgi:hypothetical protein